MPPARLAKLFAPLAVAVSLALSGAASAEPALWVAKGPHATVYLFGTVHLLKPNVNWMTPKIRKAFDESGDLTLEIADLENEQAAAPVVQKLGLDLDHPLAAKLAPADRKRLAAALKSLKASPEGFDRLRPWLAAITLSMLPLQQKGFDPKEGVDLTLERAAAARGEPVAGFETLEQQLGYFAGLPESQQISFLRQSLKEFPEVVPQLTILERDWEAGRVDALSHELNDDIKKEDPKLYELLITHRNEAFAASIAKKLEGSGVSFVAVGAGHLAGADSVQVQLEKRGYKVRKL
jgi:uncharacterized protein YbaP (TraB family)